jgi:hypothetical protein
MYLEEFGEAWGATDNDGNVGFDNTAQRLLTRSLPESYV